MVPMWTRAERFANVYAFFGLDVLFAVRNSTNHLTNRARH